MAAPPPFVLQQGCFFTRLGDNLRDVLPFCKTSWLLKLDAAITSRQDREECWLPCLRGLDITRENSDFIVSKCYEGICKRFLACLGGKKGGGGDDPAPLSIRGIRFYPAESTALTPPHLQLLSLRCPELSRINFGQMLLREAPKKTGRNKADVRLGLASGTRKGGGADEAWAQLKSLPWAGFNSLQSLIMMNSQTGTRGVKIILSMCPSLTEIGFTVSTACSLQALCSATRLEAVELSFDGKLEAQDFSQLHQLVKLRKLVFNGCNLADVLLEKVQACPLCALEITSSDFRSTSGFANLAALKGLTSLKLVGCKQVTDASLPALAGLTDLQELEIYGRGSREDDIDVTDAGVSPLCALTRLRRLVLESLHLTVHSLAIVDVLTRLETLSLKDSLDLSDYHSDVRRDEDANQDEDAEENDEDFVEPLLDIDTVPPLQGLTQLRDLDLSNTSLPNKGLTKLHALSSLEKINLSGCHVREAGLGGLLLACRGIKSVLMDSYLSHEFLEAVKGSGVDIQTSFWERYRH